jgi:hypothetical protein
MIMPPTTTIASGDYLLVDDSLLPSSAAQLHAGSTPGQGYWDFRNGQTVHAQPVFFVSVEGTGALQ